VVRRAIGEVPLEVPLVVRLAGFRSLEHRLVRRRGRTWRSHGTSPDARLLIGHLTIVTEGSTAMGFLDDAKKLAGQAQDLAAEHTNEVKQGLDKLEDFADDATGGKFSDQITSAGDRAAKFVDGLDDQ
jgi:hypothetical protein